MGSERTSNARRIATALLALVGLLGATPIAAQELPPGDEVARRINLRDEGASVSRKLVMELIDKRGHTRTRETRTYRRYFGADKKTAIFFTEPKNIRGTAFLTFDYADAEKDDDQWIYLPALRKSRRISASDRGSAFVGTDLSYDDIKNETKVSVSDYTWKTLGEEVVDQHPCLLVEAVPVDASTERALGYSKVHFWVDRKIWIVRRSQHWDRKKALLKTVDVQGIEPVQGIWTPSRIQVQNHKNGHSTIFTFSDTDYGSEVEEQLFTERRLRKGL